MGAREGLRSRPKKRGSGDHCEDNQEGFDHHHFIKCDLHGCSSRREIANSNERRRMQSINSGEKFDKRVAETLSIKEFAKIK